jgi:aspartate aminotransferase-like enzyme
MPAAPIAATSPITAPARATPTATARRDALAGRLTPGDTVLVPRCGPASERLAEAALEAGLTVETLDPATDGTLSYTRLCRRLRDDVEGRMRAVLVPRRDVETGAEADVVAVRALIDRAFHDAALMVDMADDPDAAAAPAMAAARAETVAAPAAPMRLVAA